jgi:hypothetical protein
LTDTNLARRVGEKFSETLSPNIVINSLILLLLISYKGLKLTSLLGRGLTDMAITRNLQGWPVIIRVKINKIIFSLITKLTYEIISIYPNIFSFIFTDNVSYYIWAKINPPRGGQSSEWVVQSEHFRIGENERTSLYYYLIVYPYTTDRVS